MVDVVVRKQAQGNEDAVLLPDGFQPEPNLLRDSKHLLPRFFDARCQQASPEHLGKRVARNPRDLRAHVQRILSFQQAQNAQACYAALVDLFFVLADRGFQLRHNLLLKCHATISQSQFDFLSSRLEKGLCAEDVATNPPIGSRLHNGVSGTLEIVILRKTGPKQQQLEAMVLQDPGDESACRQLLMLYRENRDYVAFSRMFSTIMGMRIAVPELWQQTEKILRQYA